MERIESFHLGVAWKVCDILGNSMMSLKFNPSSFLSRIWMFLFFYHQLCLMDNGMSYIQSIQLHLMLPYKI